MTKADYYRGVALLWIVLVAVCFSVPESLPYQIGGWFAVVGASVSLAFFFGEAAREKADG